MLKIAVVDDVKQICSEVEEFILSFGKKECVCVDVDVFYDGESFLKELQKTYYDAVFLDIELDGISGVDVSKAIRETLSNETTQILYITGNRQYAADLFDYDAIAFICKPIQNEKLFHAMKKLLKKTKTNFGLFAFKVGHKQHKLQLKDILYFESNERKVVLHTVDNEYTFYETINHLEEVLQNGAFLRIHKSYLINTIHVRKFAYENVIMIQGDCLPIAQAKRKQVREWQLQFELSE